MNNHTKKSLTARKRAEIEKMGKIKQYGTLCMGPVSLYGPFFAIYYEPTTEQIENFKKFFGWTYLTNEEFNKLSEQWANEHNNEI